MLISGIEKSITANSKPEEQGEGQSPSKPDSCPRVLPAEG